MNACDKNAVYSNKKKTVHSPFGWVRYSQTKIKSWVTVSRTAKKIHSSSFPYEKKLAFPDVLSAETF